MAQATAKSAPKRRSKLERMMVFDYINYAIMILFCITILFPMWDMVVRSLSSTKYSTGLGFMLWPKEFTLSSYQFVLSDNDIVRAFFVTVLRTVLGTIIDCTMIVLLAYPLSKRDMPGRKYITTFFLIPMFFSGGLIPSYLNIRDMGLIDSFWVYIIPGCVSVYNSVLTRNYFMSMDAALEESAFIDGAGYPRLLWSVVLPLSTPILATIALWNAVGHWNAWFDCFIYIRSGEREVVQIILRRMQDLTNLQSQEMQEFIDAQLAASGAEAVTSTSVRMAATIVTMLPILCVYPFVQKYFVKGIMIGSLKG